MGCMEPSLQSLLDPWDRQLTAVNRSIEGTNNRTLLLAAEDGDLVLRLYRTADPALIRREHRLLQELQRIRLPFATPSPLLTSAGATTARLHWLDRPVIGALFPMLPGRPPDNGNPRHAEACGRALGHLHTGLSRLPASLDPPDACPVLDHIDQLVPDPVAAAAQCGIGRSRSRQLGRLVHDCMSAHDQLGDRRHQVIHGDLFAANILISDDTVSAILDFEYAGVGPPMMDVAVAIMSICLNPFDQPDRWELARRLATGYAVTHPLPGSAAATVPMMLRRREVTSFVTRIGRHRRGEISTEELHQRADRLLELDRLLDAHGADLVESVTQ